MRSASRTTCVAQIDVLMYSVLYTSLLPAINNILVLKCKAVKQLDVLALVKCFSLAFDIETYPKVNNYNFPQQRKKRKPIR